MNRLGKSVGVIRRSSRRDIIDSVFQIGHRGHQRSVYCRGRGKAGNADSASGTDVSVLIPVGRLVYNIYKGFAPAFIFARGLTVMLPERSNTKTISVGFEVISGEAERARVTFSVPSQSMRSTFIYLFELVTPINVFPPCL